MSDVIRGNCGMGLIPHNMTTDEARDALKNLLNEVDESNGVMVSKGRLDDIAAAFERLAKTHECVRQQAEDLEKRLTCLRGYMERYTNAAEHEEYCRREAEESFRKRETALQELKRVMLEG
jgi:hypothetical protein